MKEKTLAFCRRVYLAVKQYDKDEYDNEFDGITIVDDIPYTLRGHMETLTTKLRSLSQLTGAKRVEYFYHVIDTLPLQCANCSMIQNRIFGNTVTSQTTIDKGTCITSIWSHDEGETPTRLDDITDTEESGGYVDEINLECSNCYSGYDPCEWTIAVPRGFADDLFAAAALISGKKQKASKAVGVKTPAILNQFSEIKHRPQFKIDPYDESDEGVGFPLGESMEKLFV